MPEQPPPRRRSRTIEATAIPREQREPWLPPDCDPADVYAVQAVYNGRANEEQQRRCMDFIIKEVCGVNRDAFVPGPDGDRATHYAVGKQAVGKIITSLLTMRLQPRGEQG